MRKLRSVAWPVGVMLLTLCCAAPLAMADDSKAPAARPNIVLILADDQRADTIAALGNDEIQTPHLDRLAQRGFAFTNAYCMGSMVGAVCLPSRTMLITGLSLWRIPSDQRAPVAPAGTPLLPVALRDAGYSTFHCGKRGNSCTFGNAAFEVNIETDGRTEQSATAHADQAIEFLRGRDRGRPFFLYLAPPVPHDPRLAPTRFRTLYDPARLSLPKNFLPEHPFDNGEMDIRDELLAARPRQPADMRQHLADYYATISHLDHEVGRVLGELERQQLLENTLVIYTSDQGLAVGGCHGLMGKQNLYEHVKPPLVIAGPGIAHGSSAALVYLFDLFPTICDYVGATVPPPVEGRSLRPVVEGRQPRVRDVLFAAYRREQRMIRDERFKLIRYTVRGTTTTQLFDLRSDPYELANLADDARLRDVRQRLEQTLPEQQRRFADPTAAK
jgi:arylsulfatase A-like enzyme